MDKPALKIAAFAGGFAVLGAAFGALNCAKAELDNPEKRHRSIRILEKYDGELLHMVRTISKMNDRHAKQFFDMHQALTRLITLETNLGTAHFPKRNDWPHTAFLYKCRIEEAGNHLKLYTADYDDPEELTEFIDNIVKLAGDLVHNVNLTSDQLRFES